MENHSNINNMFVPYELALKLKELGFDNECLRTYDDNGSFCNKITQKLYCAAPLWQQAFDWCLDKLKLIESYAILKDSDSYNLIIIDYYNNEIEQFMTTTTQEECLKQLIKLIE